jgi:hypothetical protein
LGKFLIKENNEITHNSIFADITHSEFRLVGIHHAVAYAQADKFLVVITKLRTKLSKIIRSSFQYTAESNHSTSQRFSTPQLRRVGSPVSQEEEQPRLDSESRVAGLST